LLACHYGSLACQSPILARHNGKNATKTKSLARLNARQEFNSTIVASLTGTFAGKYERRISNNTRKKGITKRKIRKSTRKYCFYANRKLPKINYFGIITPHFKTILKYFYPFYV
jgi:hypothetical protein